MPKRARLSRADFSALPRGSARRIHGDFLSLSVSPLSASQARASCVVSKKVSPLATARNLIQRRLRAALSAHGMPKEPLALVITAKREAAKATYAELKRDLGKVLARI